MTVTVRGLLTLTDNIKSCVVLEERNLRFALESTIGLQHAVVYYYFFEFFHSDVALDENLLRFHMIFTSQCRCNISVTSAI